MPQKVNYTFGTKLQAPPGQAGLCSGSEIYFFAISHPYILHPTQIPQLDSSHISVKHTKHRVKGIIQVIPNIPTITNIVVAIISPSVHANRFCTAHT